MDIAELARVAVTVMDPFLKAAGPILLEEGIKFGFKQIKPLYGLIHKKLAGEEAEPELLEVLAALTEDPGNEARQAALIQALQRQLETDPDFAEELDSSLRTTLQDPDTVQILIQRVGERRMRQIVVTYGPPVLQQLPLKERTFTGRKVELNRLKSGLQEVARPDEPPRIWAVVGMGGIGKSALAVEAAHGVKGSFPDGQLYVDLRGGLNNKPLDPRDVLAGFLRDLGVADRVIPPTLQERSRHFRTELADKRILLFLDNARDEKQLRPLLPGSSSCVVLVTSRVPLSGLAIPEQRRIKLKLMPAGEGRNLLERLVGAGRVSAEPEKAQEIVQLCGRLPLAIKIAGSDLNALEHLTLAVFADRLEDRKRLLKGSSLADLSVRACFDLSYQELGEETATVFRYAGLLPGADFNGDLAAGLLDVEISQARALVDALVVRQLIQWNWGNRFRFHDLVREFAREKAAADPGEVNTRYRKRMVNWYGDQVAARNEELQSFLHPQAEGTLLTPVKTEEPGTSGGPARVLDWFEGERLNVLAMLDWAVEFEDWATASRLVQDLTSFLYVRGYWRDWEAVLNTALSVAERQADPEALADALTGLGAVYRLQGKAKLAEPLLVRALGLRREGSERAGEAQTQMELGLVLQRLGQRQEAGDLFQASLALYRQLDERCGEAMVLNHLGNLRRLQGRWDRALEYFDESLDISEMQGDLLGKAISLNLKANIYRLKGEWDAAIRTFKEGLAINLELGNKYGETIAVGGLGNIYRGQGRWKHAVEMYTRNLQLAEELGDLRGKSITLNNLGRVHKHIGNLESAAVVLAESLKIAETQQLRRGQSIALRVQGEVQVKEGAFDAGLERIKQSLEMAVELGDLRCQAQSLNSLGRVYLDRPEHQEAARAALERALSIRQQKGDMQGQGQTRLNLGLLAWRQGEVEEARRQWQAGLEALDEASYDYRQIEKLLSGLMQKG